VWVEWKQKSRRGVQRHSLCPGDAKCITEILGWDKNKEVGGGTKFKFGEVILRKIIKIVVQPDLIF